MSFKAAVRSMGDVEVVDLSGRLTMGDGTGAVRNTVKELMDAHKTR
jgi:hypothetical protein